MLEKSPVKYVETMKMTFSEWLQNEMVGRGLTQSELARRSGLTQAAISLVTSGGRNPGPEMIQGVARAFGIPAEQVYRVAGLLPPKPDADPLAEEGQHILRKLQGEKQLEAIRFLRLLLKMQDEREAIKHARARKARPASSE